MKKKVIDLQVSYQTHENSFNVVFMINLMITLLRYCQNISADFGKGLPHSIA